MPEKCLLEKRVCQFDCWHCVWNPEVSEKRKKMFTAEGLTECRDGLRRFIIKRKDSEK